MCLFFFLHCVMNVGGKELWGNNVLCVWVGVGGGGGTNVCCVCV